jgi:hypothetical protein
LVIDDVDDLAFGEELKHGIYEVYTLLTVERLGSNDQSVVTKNPTNALLPFPLRASVHTQWVGSVVLFERPT